jgi:hypothetical protein
MGATPDELDELIEELTVDCHNADEQVTGFVTALEEELTSPVAATVVGEPVEVLALDYDGDPLHGLVARCRRGEATYTVSALDLVVTDDSQPSRILAAYRRWLRNEQA